MSSFPSQVPCLIPRAHFADPIPCSSSFRPSCMHPVLMCSCLPALTRSTLSKSCVNYTTLSKLQKLKSPLLRAMWRQSSNECPKWHNWALSVTSQPKALLRRTWVVPWDKHPVPSPWKLPSAIWETAGSVHRLRAPVQGSWGSTKAAEHCSEGLAARLHTAALHGWETASQAH